MSAAAYNRLLAPYGGMTPYRQRPNASMRRLSRAVKGSALLQVIARPEDGFMWGVTRQSECEALQRSAFVLGGNTPSIHLAFIRVFSQLRFLIISEVSATGYLLITAVNMPVSLTLTGFEGV